MFRLEGTTRQAIHQSLAAGKSKASPTLRRRRSRQSGRVVRRPSLLGPLGLFLCGRLGRTFGSQLLPTGLPTTQRVPEDREGGLLVVARRCGLSLAVCWHADWPRLWITGFGREAPLYAGLAAEARPDADDFSGRRRRSPAWPSECRMTQSREAREGRQAPGFPPCPAAR
jgi:hypothetical protein